MAYYSGTANSITDLKTALLTHAQADGWVLTGDVLSKAGVYFRIQVSGAGMTCLGCTDNAVANPAPNVVQIISLAYPCNYEVFGFAQELYLVVKYDTEYFRWMAFGRSTVPGLPGTGAWCGASFGTGDYDGLITISPGLEDSYGRSSSALFWHAARASTADARGKNNWVHSGLDGNPWAHTVNTSIVPPAPSTMLPLINILPSAWNSESVLMPMREYKVRGSNKISLTADLEHARNLRIDNLTPGDILVIGVAKWKIFPWYKKNAAVRNAGYAVNHSGTYGWAIRYEGP